MTSDLATASLPRPAERVAILSLVLVFLCGCVAGALLMNLRGRTLLHTIHNGNATASGLSVSVADYRKELNLTDDQTEKLTSILDDFSRYYDNVLADGNSRIMQLLNPEQRRRFQQMLRERKP